MIYGFGTNPDQGSGWCHGGVDTSYQLISRYALECLDMQLSLCLTYASF